MKFSYEWLKEYVDIALTPQELGDRLTLSSHEIESIAYVGEKLKGITTATIEKIDPHPDADKLVITQINDGSQIHQIVTGANNIAVGDIIPLTLPGSVISSGLELKATKLRGIDSNGMLCSEAELGISDSASGIWILPKDTPIGIDFIAYANLKDAILDVSILPNRGDCLSIFGLARDIAALLDLPLKKPDLSYKSSKIKNPYDIFVETPDIVPYYSLAYLENFTPHQTPLFMQRRLQLLGIRPINLGVDITNYVLLEMGQPLHAFDTRVLTETAISVAYAKDKDSFTPLNGDKKSLQKNDLIIVHNEKPIALAGVMGGLQSGLNADSKSLVLESAFFDPVTIRRTANRLNLRSESAIRFEKTVDIEQVLDASKRALHLFQRLGQAKISETISMYHNKINPRFTPLQVDVDLDAINTLLGSTFSHKEMQMALTRLGIDFKFGKANIPSWRKHDIEAMPCIAEEILRVLGAENITSCLPSVYTFMPMPSTLQTYTHALLHTFVSNGFYEVSTFPMISSTDIELCGLQVSDATILSNPLTKEESVMRPSMLPSLLKIAAYNAKRQNDSFSLIECAHIYTEKDNETLQSALCAGLLYGHILDKPYTSADNSFSKLELQHVKALVENAIDGLGLSISFKKETTSNIFHPVRHVSIYCGRLLIGHIAEIHPSIAQAYDITNDVLYFEINISILSEIAVMTPSFQDIPKFPSTRRDIALLIPRTLSYSDIELVIKKFKPNLVKEYFVFDLFESDKIGADQKSLAIAFIYQNPVDTLSDEKVNSAHARFVQFLTDNLPISVR
jgi:phenylalanyl-tRNA synthetase beta chain